MTTPPTDHFTMNLERYVRDNEYPGRLIVVGLNMLSQPVIIYGLMGRSDDSRNRGFIWDRTSPNEIVRTAQVEETRLSVAKRRLVIYNALGTKDLADGKRAAFVSNGAQTDTLLNLVQRPIGFAGALSRWKYEPDSSRTPRISAIITMGGDRNEVDFAMSVIKANPKDPKWALRLTYDHLPQVPGVGHMLSTYDGNGNPLPSFSAKYPIAVPIVDDGPHRIAETYWEAMNSGNKVALVVRTFTRTGVQIDTHIINGSGRPKR